MPFVNGSYFYNQGNDAALALMTFGGILPQNR